MSFCEGCKFNKNDTYCDLLDDVLAYDSCIFKETNDEGE